MNAHQHRTARRSFERYLSASIAIRSGLASDSDFSTRVPSARFRCRCGHRAAPYVFICAGSVRAVCKGCGIASEIADGHVVSESNR